MEMTNGMLSEYPVEFGGAISADRFTAKMETAWLAMDIVCGHDGAVVEGSC
jgi:hypothetical protein